MSRKFWVLLLPALVLLGQGCKDDETIDCKPDGMGDLVDIPYAPQDYDLELPTGFPPLEIPDDNPLTVDGVELGRHLFYDPILSADSTMSCASCHLQSGSFTDNAATSIGIDGIEGTRSSMSLLNIGFNTNGLFWDGRSTTLEEQALLPVEDPIELHHTWPDLVEQLIAHPSYPEMFRKAFGIEDRSEITKELAAKAIAQFERIIISSDSKFDKRFLQFDLSAEYTDSELRGYDMFFDIPGSPLPDAQCFHCHDAPLFSNNEYFNNGLDSVETLMDFPDLGRGIVTGKLIDNGKFKAPTLRNIAYTAPYMHDGSLETLEEVLDFYNEGVHYAENLDENLLVPLGLSESMKQDLINFLHTLSDTTFLNNPALSNPFE